MRNKRLKKQIDNNFDLSVEIFGGCYKNLGLQAIAV